VHSPYSPRPPYDRIFDENYQGPLSFQVTIEDIDRLNQTRRQPDEPDVRHLISLYDGEIRYMDEQVGAFFKRLRRMGVLDQSVVVFTSDHGEEFAEHGRVGLHGYNLYDEVLHVPLLIRRPGVEPQRVDRQVRLIDLPLTLLGLMNVEAGHLFEGQDLFAEGQEPAQDLPTFSEMTDETNRHWASLRTGEYKFIGIRGLQFELFDLRSDPGEKTNLFGDNPALDSRWQRRLGEQVQSNLAAAPAHHPSPVKLDDDVKRQLRALGYIE
jgi:arylsulfatase A-like enzyme